jgi:hypothetical protein
MTDAQTPIGSPDALLWEALKHALRWVVKIFGEPVDLLDDLARRRGDVLPLRAWLRGLETLARALLLAMAGRLPQELSGPEPARKRAGQSKPHARPEPTFATFTDYLTARPVGSERWADVVFRVTPRMSLAAVAREPHRSPGTCLPTRALAYRLEALIRVAEGPARYASRIARRLRAEPALAARVLRRLQGEGRRPTPCDELIEEARALARVFRPGTG